MNQPKNLNPIINLLGQHEEMMAELYKTYAQKFPDSEFWQNLAKAEHVHYQWVKHLSDPGLKEIYLNEEIFQSAGIETSLGYIQELITKASNHTLINALSYALDIETAMIERRYFEIFESDSPKVKQILADLAAATVQHEKMIRAELKRVKEVKANWGEENEV